MLSIIYSLRFTPFSTFDIARYLLYILCVVCYFYLRLPIMADVAVAKAAASTASSNPETGTSSNETKERQRTDSGTEAAVETGKTM